MIEVGHWTIRSVVNGYIRLDGGAMFGVVPKTLWARSQDVDDQNRILLATRTLLAVNRRAGRILLVDTGTGSKWSCEQANRFAVQSTPAALDAALGEVGAQPEDVTDVIVTHLHFDHAGGMTSWADQPGGPVKLRFPKASHWIHRNHWDHAHNPTKRDKASFISADFAGLEAAGVLRFLAGEATASAIEGVRWFLAHGHSPYQLLPWFDSGGQGRDLLFVGDMVPTSSHLPPAWVMAYDLQPLVTLAERERVYARCRDEGLLLAFPHDRHHGIARIAFDDSGRPEVAEPPG